MTQAWENLDWGSWLYGLWAAVIGGGSTAASGAIAVISVDPKDFNLETAKFWKVVGAMFTVGAVTNFFAFLSQKPIPKQVTREEAQAIINEPGRQTTVTASKTITTEEKP